VQLRHINRSGPAFSKHTVNFCLAAGSHFANLSQPILCSVGYLQRVDWPMKH